MYTQASQLPFAIDTYDPGTLRDGLPQSNEVFPEIQLPPGLTQPQVGQLVSEFRAHLQQRIGRSPIHTFTYNLMSNGYFSTQIYRDWVQRVVDFAEYLIVGKGYTPTQAIPKAIGLIYDSMLALTGGTYPDILPYLNGDVQEKLKAAADQWQYIQQDILEFQRNGRRPLQQQGYVQAQPQPYGGGYGQQLPPVNMGYGRPQGGPQLAGGYAPSPVGTPMGYQPQHQATTTTQPTGGMHSRYDTPPAPTQSWSTGPAQAPAAPTPPPAQPSTAWVAPLDTDKPVPESLEQLVMDPFYYTPPGIEIDRQRPYSRFYNPGGIEIRPAVLSGWKRTRSDASPYAQLYDPSRFVMFHVRWPDGVVNEYLVERTDAMDYLDHEIDAVLRAEKIKPEGKVVASTQHILDCDEPAQPVKTFKKSLDDGLDIRQTSNPVILDGLFTASTELENEDEARRQVIEQLGLLEEEIEALPAHEYLSAKLYPLPVSKEGEERMLLLASSDSLSALAQGLVEAVNDGLLPLRHFRFLDRRLTQAVNQMLADNLSFDGLEIESFVDDIEDLFAHLTNKEGPEVVQVIQSRTHGFLQRWLNLKMEEIDDDGESLYLVDEAINLQTGWHSEALIGLALEDGAALIKKSTHPKLARTVESLLGRHKAAGTLVGRRVRLITLDGLYLDIFPGWLIEHALLVKKADV